MALLRIFWMFAASTGVTMAASDQTVLVTGATGKTGALLYTLLKEKAGVTVRGLVRNVSKARLLLNCSTCDESEGIFVGDVTKKDTLMPAMAGVTSLAIATAATPQCSTYSKSGPPTCTYPQGGYPVDIDFNGVKTQLEVLAEATRGAPALVSLCSSMGTTDPDNFLNKLGNGSILFYKLNAEAFIMSSGLPYAIVKPCGLTDAPGGERELVVAHDDEMMHLQPPMVPRADVARVMAQALLQPSVAGDLRFDLCSKEGPATQDLAALLASTRYPWQHPAAGQFVV